MTEVHKYIQIKVQLVYYFKENNAPIKVCIRKSIIKICNLRIPFVDGLSTICRYDASRQHRTLLSNEDKVAARKAGASQPIIFKLQ